MQKWIEFRADKEYLWDIFQQLAEKKEFGKFKQISYEVGKRRHPLVNEAGRPCLPVEW